MKTVKRSLIKRLAAQAKEARVQGLTKVADSLDNQLSKITSRHDDEIYIYSSDKFRDDIEKDLWNIMIRSADFYGCNIDGAGLQKVIEKASEQLLSEFRVKSGIVLDVGANEPTVPGETENEHVLMVEEE